MLKKISLVLLFAMLAANDFVAGQSFQNLDFRELCDTSKTGLCLWDLSWGKKGSVSPNIVDNENCLLIQGENETSVGFVEQSSSFLTAGDIQIITVSADIKSDGIEGKGAGLNLGLYDKNGNLIANKDMGGFYSLDWIKGTNNWKEYSISIVCPTETETIKIGMILYGKGKVWYKNYKVAIIPVAGRKPSMLAKDFITDACNIIKTNSLVRDSININELKESALRIAGEAKKYSDCYLAISYLLESLRPYGDSHSFFMTAEEMENWKDEGSQVSKIQLPSYKFIDSCGYISIPAFHGGNPEQILTFADSIQAAIASLSLLKIKGWIIDLRQNTGGNMAPMIAGLGPLFSSGKLGSLVDVNGIYSSWYYADGRYYWDNDTGWTVSNPIRLTSKLPIGVLAGNQTGSSGEAVVVSFIGNEKTKLFGQSTWGLTTGNGSFELKDGSQIFLASTVMADRYGKLYHERIIPDFVIEDKETIENDLVIRAVVKWILSL